VWHHGERHHARLNRDTSLYRTGRNYRARKKLVAGESRAIPIAGSAAGQSDSAGRYRRSRGVSGFGAGTSDQRYGDQRGWWQDTQHLDTTRFANSYELFARFGLAFDFAPDVLRAIAARMSALNAFASTFSPSWMSIARRTFPSRLALKSLAGSFNEAPLAKVNFTLDLYDSPVQMIPSCAHTGMPIHFHSS